MIRPRNISSLNAGFTLVEIMVVVAIMSLLLGLAFMNFRKISQKAPLEQAVSDLEGLCRRARSEAIVKSRPMDVTMDVEMGQLKLSTAPRAVFAQDTESGGALVGSVEEAAWVDQAMLPSDVTLDIVLPVPAEDAENPNVVTVRFYPNGTAEPFEAVMALAGEGVYTLVLDPVTGRLKVRDGEDGL